MRISDWSSDVCSSDLDHLGSRCGHCGTGSNRPRRPSMAIRMSGMAMRAATGALALGLAACSNYVTREDFDAAIADLRGADQRQPPQIDTMTQETSAERRSGKEGVRSERTRGYRER